MAKSIRKSKRKSKRKKRKLTELEIEQNLQQKEIRTTMSNMGFSRAPHIDGTQFQYEGRTTELDDIFYFENIIVIAEYTVGHPGDHLKGKKIIYDKINADTKAFLKFVSGHDKFKPFNEILKSNILSNYTWNQLQVRVIYASKKNISAEHKGLVQGVKYFDYAIVKYFESLSKVIKRTARFEFFDYLEILFSVVGENIKSSSIGSDDTFSGHILPEEQSSFKEGYKIVSFYIDANSLMKRAYVLRRDGWRDKSNVGLYQRMLQTKKIKKMRQYLNNQQRVFINNIIVTLPEDRVKLLDSNEKELSRRNDGNFVSVGKTIVTPAIIKIENKANIIGIIDGQHRSFSYHEGDDVYEKKIAKLRTVQNLLVTGILYPKAESDEKRLKFEAELFLEINSNQTKVASTLIQEIESIKSPFLTISISKYIINKLNESGPLEDLFENYWFEKSKLKTSSIISFGLRPLVKLEGDDSLFKAWNNASKQSLVNTEDNYDLLTKYKEFCVEEVRKIFIALKGNVDKERWIVDRKDPKAILNVTTINGMINCLRLVIQNNKLGTVEQYKQRLRGINSFNFKKYKSSQYRKMGQAIYDKYFL